MTRHILANFLKFAMGLAVLCLAFWPKATRADATDVVTYNFTGTAMCEGGLGSGGACGSVASGASATVTGTFQFDADAEAMGNWSFSLPNGISISGNGALTEEGGATDNNDQFVFEAGNPDFGLVFSDPSDVGTLVTGITSSGFRSGFVNSTGFFVFTSGSATPQTVSATPELSSLLLLGTGLLGLGPFIRRFAVS